MLELDFCVKITLKDVIKNILSILLIKWLLDIVGLIIFILIYFFNFFIL